MHCPDRFGQVTRKVQTVKGVASALHYAYTNVGRLVSLTYPDGSVADYGRDSQGRISQIGLTRSGLGREVVISQVTHAAFGPPTGWAYPALPMGINVPQWREGPGLPGEAEGYCPEKKAQSGRARQMVVDMAGRTKAETCGFPLG